MPMHSDRPDFLHPRYAKSDSCVLCLQRSEGGPCNSEQGRVQECHNGLAYLSQDRKQGVKTLKWSMRTSLSVQESYQRCIT